MISPKLISVTTKSGDDITPAEMMRDHLGLSQRQLVEAMAERVQATPCRPWEKIMDREAYVGESSLIILRNRRRALAELDAGD